MQRRTKILIGSVAGLLVVGVGAVALIGPVGGAPSTARVARADFQVFVEANGKLEAEVAYEIGPPSVQDFWSYNLSWMIPEGQFVDAGTVIARFDATQLEDRLRDHKASLEKVLQEKEKEQRNLEVALKQLRLDLVKAEGELKVVDLDLQVPEGLVALIEVQQARLQRDLAAKRVAFLTEKIVFERELVASKLELLDVKRRFEEEKIASIQSSIDKFAVKAPVAGLVVYVPKQNGDRWEIGGDVWMLAKIMKVADVSTLRVEANVLEVDAARLAPGQSAEITIDAVPGLLLTSQITEIGRIVRERSAQDRSKVFDAILPLGEVDTGVLRPGMGVQVTICTETLRDRLILPLEAVRNSAQGPWVEVIGATGTERRSVTLGARNAGRVVVEDGLNEGDTVRLAGRQA